MLPNERTQQMDPVTPDLIPDARQGAQRAQAYVHVAAPASPKPDKSLHTTQVSPPHRSGKLPDTEPLDRTMLEARPRGAPAAPPSLSAETQPHADNPFRSRRAQEPASGDDHAAPRLRDLDEEPATRNERPRSPSSLDIEADIVSEVKRLRTDPGSFTKTQPGEAPITQPGLGPQGRGEVDLLEVLAFPAPVGRRFGALLVDAAVLGTVVLIIGLVVLMAGKAPPVPAGLGLLDALAMRVSASPKLVAAIAILAAGCGAAYATLFAVAWSGRTVGRRLLGLHLVDGRGRPPTPTRALARSMVALLSLALGGAGFWWWLFDRKSQSLHDKVCSTFVVRLKQTG